MTPFIEAATVAGYVMTSFGIIWSVAIAYRGRRFVRNIYEGNDDRN